MILGDYNQARPNGPTENATLQARRPIQGFQEIQIAWGGGEGDYQALQFKVEQRYSRGLYLLNSFTWARARDNASGHLEVQNNDNSRVNYRNLDGRVRPLGLRPAAQQHHQLRVGAAVRQGPPLRLGHECGARRRPGRLERGRHQHDDQRHAGQPLVLAGGGLLGQRQPDLPPEPDRRSADARGPAHHRQLPEPCGRRDPDRSVAAVRQRRRATSPAGPASRSSTSACTRRSASAATTPVSSSASRRSTCSTARTSARRTRIARTATTARSRRRQRPGRFRWESRCISERRQLPTSNSQLPRHSQPQLPSWKLGWELAVGSALELGIGRW